MLPKKIEISNNIFPGYENWVYLYVSFSIFVLFFSGHHSIFRFGRTIRVPTVCTSLHLSNSKQVFHFKSLVVPSAIRFRSFHFHGHSNNLRFHCQSQLLCIYYTILIIIIWFLVIWAAVRRNWFGIDAIFSVFFFCFLISFIMSMKLEGSIISQRSTDFRFWVSAKDFFSPLTGCQGK